MSALVLTYSTALLLGSLHALEADHMAAVTAFVVRRPGVRDAVRFAIRWSAGHGGAIILIGAGLLLLGVRLPEATEHLLERFVGVVMIGLGFWAFRGARALHSHPHVHADGTQHDHVHSHAFGHAHKRGHAATAVGLVHGLAGSGAAVALIPVIGFESPAAGVAYLVVFAVGTVVAMGLYGLLAGAIFGRTAGSSLCVAHLLARSTGVFTVAVGVVWLVR
jgi:nickel/cobalt transporter (NicO) family protein